MSPRTLSAKRSNEWLIAAGRLDDDLPLLGAHRLGSDVEAAILAQYPGTDITIHLDPVSLGVETGDISDPDVTEALSAR
jgi:hypothetical protein